MTAARTKQKEINFNPKLKTVERDQNGLITDNESLEYKFKDNGLIDWKAMIRPEHLYPNKQWFEKRNQKVPTSPEGLDDKQVLILLAGIKELAKIRGYVSVSYEPVTAQSDYVCTVCKIKWIGNYETEMREVEYSDMADAHPYNTNDFAMYYPAAIASNRAFVRCVRNFLNIDIVGFDEIGVTPEKAPSTTVENITDPKYLLSSMMKENNVPFNIVKDILVEQQVKGAEGFEGVKDIPNLKAFTLIEELKKQFSS